MKRHVKMLMPLLAVAATAFGATGFYFAHQPEGQGTQAASAPPQALPATSAPSEGEYTVLKVAAAGAPAQLTAPPSAAAPAAMFQWMGQVMKDPNVQQMVSAGQRLGVRRAYGELVKQLQLSPEQTAQFYQLLVDAQNKAFQSVTANGGNAAAMAAAMNSARAETDASMLTLLGGDKFLTYQDYQKTLPERVEVASLNQQLDAVNAPLSDAQRTSLLSAMEEERTLVPPPGNPGGGSAIPFIPVGAAQQQWQSDYDARVRERAATILNADQLKQFDQLQSQQVAAWHMIGQYLPGSGGTQAP
jgi:hypothetical protein